MRALGIVVVCVVCGAVGALAVQRWAARRERGPDTAAVVERIREVARLETLDASLYKKIDFAPDPKQADTLLGALGEWAKHTVRPPAGKAIVFADAHLAVDLRKLGPKTLRVEGRRLLVVLPRVETRIELRPGETEVIGSNLDSKETALLLDAARASFQSAVESDASLQERARESARKSLRLLVGQLGFTDVQFVDELPRPATGPAAPAHSAARGYFFSSALGTI